jgi:hypothetical protein
MAGQSILSIPGMLDRNIHAMGLSIRGTVLHCIPETVPSILETYSNIGIRGTDYLVIHAMAHPGVTTQATPGPLTCHPICSNNRETWPYIRTLLGQRWAKEGRTTAIHITVISTVATRITATRIIATHITATRIIATHITVKCKLSILGVIWHRTSVGTELTCHCPTTTIVTYQAICGQTLNPRSPRWVYLTRTLDTRV